MRLADFILGNSESILAEWEVFARGISSGATLNKLALRDHAADVLRAIARDMMSTQTALQRSDKSKGMGAILFGSTIACPKFKGLRKSGDQIYCWTWY